MSSDWHDYNCDKSLAYEYELDMHPRKGNIIIESEMCLTFSLLHMTFCSSFLEAENQNPS